ncbi:tyrosine-protein phosphatase non-receptor type substrate 1-like isoform X2 [Tiliqua scincoides]|uniref:tyrosine-protein phosphatase non-receptor type substrate 1-like isoform X2 n=1 Tax=Tiliqua scincoides TaxID=71010 RepID=UPI0034632E12
MDARGLWTCLLLPLLLGRWPGARGQDLEVLQTPGPVSLSAGETLALNCTLTGLSLPGGVRWYKGLDRNQQPIYSEKASQSIPRVTRVVPESGEDFSIRISNIRPEDAGTYYCVKFRAGSPEKEYRSGKGTVVSVIATPSQPLISGPPSRVTSGASATFNCTSDGFSPRDIEVTWYKDRSPISAPPTIVLPEGESTSYQAFSTVDVRLTDKDVKSQLTCQIRHRTLKASLQQVFRLGDVLRVPPKVQLETNPSLPIPLNASVRITCNVEGFYPNDTSLVWLENSRKTEEGKASPMIQNPAGTFSLKNSLELTASLEKNKTVFACQVTHNSQPPVTEELTLEVGVQPEKDGISDSAGPGDTTVFIVVALVCALLVVLVIAVIYLIKARQNKGKDSTSVRLHESEKTSGGTNQVPDPNNVEYADLNFDKAPKKSPRQAVEPSQQSEYASIQTGQPAPNDDNVTYADLDMVHLSKAPKRPAPKPEEASSEYASVQVQSK